MLLMATILHLGKSSLPKKPITDDDVDRISLCLKVLSECSPLMNDIFNKECRQSLSHMLSAKLEEEKLSQKVSYYKRVTINTWSFLWMFTSELVPEMSPFDSVSQPLFDCFSVLRNGIHCEFLNYSLPAERI